MSLRLEHSKPKCVAVDSFTQLFVYTDASFEPSAGCGGLGAVLVDAKSHVLAWFGVALDSETCASMGAQQKGTIIYELELLAAVLALQLWSFGDGDDLVVHFGDIEGVRFASGNFGEFLMEHFLKLEALPGTRTWFARVPTEANLTDFPSRGVHHPLLVDSLDVSVKAKSYLQSLLDSFGTAVRTMSNGGGQIVLPPCENSVS